MRRRARSTRRHERARGSAGRRAVWLAIGVVLALAAGAFALWLDAGALGDNLPERADFYGTAMIVLAWLLLLLVIVAAVQAVRRR